MKKREAPEATEATEKAEKAKAARKAGTAEKAGKKGSAGRDGATGEKEPRGGTTRDVMTVLGRLRRLRNLLEASPEGVTWEDLFREIYGASPERDGASPEAERLRRSARRTFERDCALLASLAEEDEDNPLGGRVVYNRRTRRYGPAGRDRALSVCLHLLGDDVRVLRSGLLLAEHFLPQWRENCRGVWKQLAKLVKPEQARTGESLAGAVAVAVPVSSERCRGFTGMKDAFPKVVRALEERRMLRFRYRSPYVGMEKTLDLRVSPWGVYFKHHAWYLWGKAVEFDGPGPFRLSRMQAVEVLDASAEAPALGARLEDIALRDFDPKEAPGTRYAVKLRIRHPFAVMAAETAWYPQQRISAPDKDGSVLFEATVTSLEEISRWILRAADCMEVLEPEVLREKVLGKARALIVAHEEPRCVGLPEVPSGAVPPEDRLCWDEEGVLNLTQHVATEEQRAASVREPGQKEEVQRLLTFETLPSPEEVRRRAAALAELAKGERIRRVMIGGAPFLMGELEEALLVRGLVPVYAFSERASLDEVQPDGSVRRTLVFRHRGFVETGRTSPPPSLPGA